MKNVIFTLMVMVLAAGFAFAWEGNATIVASGDLPGGGFSIATNALPVNTVVDITNLENQRTLRVIVASGLEASGLLATVSRSAADILEIRENSVHRVLLQQPSEAIAYSHLQQLGLSHVPVPVPVVQATPPQPVPARIEPEQPFAPPVLSIGSVSTPIAEAPLPVDDTVMPAENIIIVSSVERVPPGNEHVLAPELFIPPIQPVQTHPAAVPPQQVSDPPPVNPDFSPFEAPLISSLEQGMWYVQIAAFSRPDNVEDEIRRIGTGTYPIAIQNVGTDTNPMFRILLGPFNQGESSAMLQRIRSIGYSDAFVRSN